MTAIAAANSRRMDDIAVIGLSCLFPGAPDLATFWRNIVSKVSAISTPPPEAWDETLYYDAASDENDRVYCRKGGYLGPLAFFDPLEHGIMPRAVEGGEPDQWLALHVARQALRDAGYPDGCPSKRAALILGKGTYANRGTISVVYHGVVIDFALQLLKTIHPELTTDDLRLVREDLKRHLPRFDAETAPALIPNVTAGRIANRLDLMGPSYTIDAACASSLVAVDVAVKGLRHREYDLALVGGMQVATPVPVLSLFCRLKALSLTECIRPFDKDADGTLLSEGVGMAVLKRRADAERDGDRIYACVKGTGVASDGRAVSVLAPRIEGEELAVRRAYENAGVSPRTVGLVEAHGTATLVGDAVEVEALGRVFGERGPVPRCALGSVKSMIGHTMPAAGMAGFIKSALALYHKVLPPTIGVTEPSPRLKLEATPFYINSETRPWIHGDPEQPRRAGVNAFGFGGINSHVLLEEVPTSAGDVDYDNAWDSEVFVLRGTTRAEATALANAVVAAVRSDSSASLGDLAFSVNTRANTCHAQDVVVGIVASSGDDLVRKIERTVARLAQPDCHKIKDAGGIYFFEQQLAKSGQLAFLFPGEGAQYVNMLADLCRHFPEARGCFDEMDRHFAHHPRGYVVSDVVFPPPAFSEAERARQEQRLWEMDAAVEAVYTANHAMHTLLSELGIRPDAMLGHSTGEHWAIRAAGMLDEEQYSATLHELRRIHQSATAAGTVPQQVRLIAVGADRDVITEVCAPFGQAVSIAMDNCRHQVVLVAEATVSSGLEEALREKGLLYEVLAFDRPYHTPLFERYAEGLKTTLSRVIARPPAVRLYSATTVGEYPAALEDIRTVAYEHWLKSVEFRRTIEKMHEDGVRIFVEAGPRGNLTAFVDDILAGRTYTAVASNVSRRSGTMQLHHLLAQLAAHGVALTLAPLYRHRQLNAIDLAQPAKVATSPRPLGRLKIPTGAPEMRLSSDVAERIRARAHGHTPNGPVATASAGAPASPAAVEDPRPADQEGSPGAPLASSATGSPDRYASFPAPQAAGGNPPAAQVMSAFVGTMGHFLGLQQEVLGWTFGPLSQAATQDPSNGDHGDKPGWTTRIRPRSLPFIQSVASQPAGPDGDLIAHCTLDLDACPALRDHTLGRRVSVVDPELAAFPIVPFTVLMEIMAEAGAGLFPTQVLTEMRDVRVHRWLAVDAGPVAIEMRAHHEGNGHVTVTLYHGESGERAAVAEGLMVFAPTYSPAPQAVRRDMPDGQPYKWPPQQLYEEAMFHGPSFRGVASVDRVSPGGAEASLVVQDRTRLLREGRGADLVTDFVTLDLPGQVVGFWAAQFLEDRFLVLPFRMETLKLYGPPLPASERLTCLAQTALIGDQRVRSTLDVVRADGRVWARFEGWEDRRFDVPPHALRMLLKPELVMLSKPWAARLHEHSALCRFTVRCVDSDVLPDGWLLAHSGLWMRVLATIVLSRRERAAWHALTLPSRRREWLVGRIAAKDAVREYVRQQFGLTLHPADIEILPDENGCPHVRGEWTRRLGSVPLVSISHLEGVALGIAGEAAGVAGLGIDLERLGRMQPTTARVAFSDQELEILAGLDPAKREAWSLRLWCAKEACAKATGQGFAGGIHAFSVRGVDQQQGAVRITVEGSAGETTHLVALTAQHEEWIVATCAAAAEEGVRQ